MLYNKVLWDLMSLSYHSYSCRHFQSTPAPRYVNLWLHWWNAFVFGSGLCAVSLQVGCCPYRLMWFFTKLFLWCSHTPVSVTESLCVHLLQGWPGWRTSATLAIWTRPCRLSPTGEESYPAFVSTTGPCTDTCVCICVYVCRYMYVHIFIVFD